MSLSSQDHDFSRAYAVQGEANSPFKTFAEVPTEIGIATSIEHSSAQWQQVAAQDALQQASVNQAMAQPMSSAPPLPSPEGPTHGR
jgi:hypothetical protein